MNRREFVASAGVTAAGMGSFEAGAVSAEASPNRAPRAVKMMVGCQLGPTTPKRLDFFKRHGVTHVCVHPRATGPRGNFTADDLRRTRDLCEKHGIVAAMVALPFLTSSHIDHERRGAIMLGASPERDRDIADIQEMIAACSQAGIPAFKYNMSLLGVLRTHTEPGRGGSRNSAWRLKDATPAPPATRAGRVDEATAWERIAYFLERVIPVCEQHRIRAACHPHDPGVPPEGYQGIRRVLGTFEGLKRFVGIKESPYHGLNLCLGTMAENLRNPREEIHEVIRRFGERGKIFNIHFRNIKGGRDDFREVYPDEGDMDMVQVARTLRDVGYEGMLMPDHMPTHSDDPGGEQAFAFGYGYIRGILQAVSSERERTG